MACRETAGQQEFVVGTGEVSNVHVDATLFLALLGTVVAAPLSRQAAASRVIAWLVSVRWPIVVYCCSRLALLLVAGLDTLITHRSLAAELSLFDGRWYLKVASQGYPSQALHAKSTLGFLPLYPLVIRGVASLFSWPLLAAALLVSVTGGLAAVLLLRRLAAAWWGEATARRAVLLFCLFPGSVVFSMAYSECLTLPLVLGCLLALRSERWLVAGVLAGFASAAEPAAVILFPVCLAVAWRRISASSWRDPVARRSLLAPLLAPSGLALFAVYLWIHTGTPLASYEAQHYGWHQGDPLTLLSQPAAEQLTDQPSLVFVYLRNLSLWNGLLGSVFLVAALVALRRVRAELTPGVMLWTYGVGAMTVWSVMSLTNARMLLIAFPAVIIWARTLPRGRFALFLGAEAVLFLLASGLTLARIMLP
jgi:mannosyltransferase PIG-V